MAEVSRDQEERLRSAVYLQDDPDGRLPGVLAEILPIVIADPEGARAVGHAIRVHLERVAESELMARRGEILFDGEFRVQEGTSLEDLQKGQSGSEAEGLREIELNYCQLFPRRSEDGTRVLLRKGDHALVNAVYLLSAIGSRRAGLVKAIVNKVEGWVVVIDGDRSNVGFIYMRETGAELPASYAHCRVVFDSEGGRLVYKCGDEVVQPVMGQAYGGSGESYGESFEPYRQKDGELEGVPVS